MDDREIMRILTECGVVRQGHFVGTSGRHLDHYFDKNKLFRNPVAFERLCEELARRCLGEDIIEVVIGPMVGGGFVGQRLAYHLSLLQGNAVTFLFAEKPEKVFLLKRGQEQSLQPGAKTLAVEDVITTGLSMKDGAVDIALSFGLDVVAAATLCNRGKAPADIGITGPIYALLDIAWPSWAATDEEPCLPCAQGVPMDTDVGHGQAFLDQLNQRSIDEGRGYGPLPG
jgi:orotate phosphoribosyltransferase